MKLERSHELWEEGKKYMPSGVSAGGRVNVACGMPHYIDHAEGARLYTVDDQEFIDYHGGRVNVRPQASAHSGSS